ncbi:hypothetical protein Vretifemale_5152, partial [Volvox reticuliferus]
METPDQAWWWSDPRQTIAGVPQNAAARVRFEKGMDGFCEWEREREREHQQPSLAGIEVSWKGKERTLPQPQPATPERIASASTCSSWGVAHSSAATAGSFKGVAVCSGVPRNPKNSFPGGSAEPSYAKHHGKLRSTREKFSGDPRSSPNIFPG